MLHYGPPLHHLRTVADFAATVAEPSTLPEFEFSPRVRTLSRGFTCVECARIIHGKHVYIGNTLYCETCAQNVRLRYVRDRRPYSAHEQTEPEPLRPSEIEWRQGRLVWDKKPIKPHTKPPKDTVPPYQQELEDADADLNHLLATQCCAYHRDGGTNFEHKGALLDLPMVGQELAQLGLPSTNLNASSSEDSDDTLEAVIADRRHEEDAIRYGVPVAWTIKNPGPAITNLAGLEPTFCNVPPCEEPHYPDEVTLDSRQMRALQQRIDWERSAFACGPVQRFWLTTLDGALVPASSERGNIPPEIVQRLVQAAGLLSGRPVEDLMETRKQTAHYGHIGSFLYGKWNGRHPVTSIVSDARWRLAETSENGPQEIGDADPNSTSEPPEAYLWPVTVEEVVWNLQHGITLSPIEKRWLQKPEQERLLRALERGGFTI